MYASQDPEVGYTQGMSLFLIGANKTMMGNKWLINNYTDSK
jgi:hypothetical protein